VSPKSSIDISLKSAYNTTTAANKKARPQSVRRRREGCPEKE
jgi:hypothetical protein